MNILYLENQDIHLIGLITSLSILLIVAIAFAVNWAIKLRNARKVKADNKINIESLKEDIYAIANDVNGKIGLAEIYIYFDENGKEESLTLSKNFRNVYGISDNSPAPKNVEELNEYVYKDDRERVFGKFRALINGEKENPLLLIEFRVNLGNGEIHWMRLCGKIIYYENGAPRLFGSIVFDINERKVIERQNAEELSVLYTVLHNFDNLLLVSRNTGNIRIFRDKKYEELYPEDNEFKKHFRKYVDYLENYIDEYVVIEDREYLREKSSIGAICDALESELEYVIDYRLIDGDDFRYYQMVFNYADNRLARSGWFVVGFRNIDRAKRTSLKYENDLKDALAAAQQSSNSKTIFLNNISHDIRTPMNAIIGFTNLASSNLDNKNLVENYLSKILTSGNHLLSLINDVLDMSRIESGKMRIYNQNLSLPDLIHDIKTIVLPEASKKKIDVVIEANDIDNESFLGDKLRLSQVLLNILSNAVKFTDVDGKIEFIIKQINKNEEGFVTYEFHIKDNGIGMSGDFKDHIFEAFAREHSTTLSGIQGTGLGMTITKNIVDMMNGKIVVESEEGVGSEFIVTLRFEIAQGNENVQNLEQLSNLYALIIDEDINTCLGINKILCSINMNAKCVQSGKDAINLINSEKENNKDFDIFFVSNTIKNEDGLEIVKEIKNIVGESKPIILMDYDFAEIETSSNLGFLSKPIFDSELKDVLVGRFNSGVKKSKEETFDFSRKKILLVEDNLLNQEIATEILKNMNLLIDVADNGKIALEKIENSDENTYSLIMMDIQMPIMDGYEATKQIRSLENKNKASLPIIALTANALLEDKDKALNTGMNGHISKPFDISVLGRTIKALIK